MEWKGGFLGLIQLFLPSLIWAIDCTNPLSGLERAICVDPDLHKNFEILERKVQALSHTDPRIAWSQKAWMDRLRRDCTARGRWCIHSHLQQRTMELSTRMSTMAQGSQSPLPDIAHLHSSTHLRVSLPHPLPRNQSPNTTNSARSMASIPIQNRISSVKPPATIAPIPGPPPIIDGKITWQLRNAGYTIYGKYYRLRNGRYHNRAESAYVDFGRILAVGDFDGDGGKEYLVSVYFNGGGSGIFAQLYLVTFQNSRPVASLPYELPDRSDIRGAAIGRGVITLSTVEPGPDDPSCCPSVHRIYRLGLRGGKLVDLP